MLSYDFFLDLAIILLATKLFGVLAKKLHLPQVVGALIAGLILGPTLLNLVHESEFIDKMAELGVIVIMFTAGMETDMKQLKSTGKASIVIALLGILLPLGGGFLIAGLYYQNMAQMSQIELFKNIFIGVILTATSVSITVEALREMGKLKTKTGTTILGAAIIDDIVGIIILTMLISFGDASVDVIQVIVKILLFFVAAIVVGLGANYMFKKICQKHGRKRRRMPIYSFVFCLIMAFGAEKIFGVADITGAYMAGIIISNISLSNTTLSEYVTEKVEVTSYLLLSPIFFASIGIKATVGQVDLHMILFASALLAVAVITKMGGCGFGAKMCGFSNKDALRVGTGMVARGEVALIVADRGVSAGLMSADLLTPIIILVIATSLLTPILLKFQYKGEIASKEVKHIDKPVPGGQCGLANTTKAS
jgi:Kef-type K+ transport system membrane component KefB